MKFETIEGVSKQVSRVILGTGFVTKGGDPALYWEIMDQAFASGINAIDSGREYADGFSDECIGKWLQKRGNREQVVLVSKGCHHNDWRRRVTPFDLSADLFDSLAVLQTDYIDVYMLHRDDPSKPVGLMVEALNEHYEAGRIRAFGASNWEYERIREANQYAAAHGLRPFLVASQHFSLGVQVQDPWGGGCVSLTGDLQAPARQWYACNKLPLLAYSTLSMGLLSGRVSKENFHDMVVSGKLSQACARAYGTTENLERVLRARWLAAEKGISMANLATAYVLNYTTYEHLTTFALIGAESGAEIQNAAEAVGVLLSKAEMDWLNLKADQL